MTQLEIGRRAQVDTFKGMHGSANSYVSEVFRVRPRLFPSRSGEREVVTGIGVRIELILESGEICFSEILYSWSRILKYRKYFEAREDHAYDTIEAIAGSYAMSSTFPEGAHESLEPLATKSSQPK